MGAGASGLVQLPGAKSLRIRYLALVFKKHTPRPHLESDIAGATLKIVNFTQRNSSIAIIKY